MSRYELNKINNLVMKAAKALYDNEKFPIGVLAVRARKLAEVYPNDRTVVSCSNVLNKQASKKTFITRAELKNIYNKLFSNNNKFAIEFKDELGLVNHDPRQLMTRDPKEGQNLTEEAYKKLGDSLLSEQLQAAMNGNDSYNLYTKETSKIAQKTCLRELNSFGAVPKKMSVVAGQADILICQATYETPKGHSSVLIPVEIKNGRALAPGMFLSLNGFVSLNGDNLSTHLKTTAGKSFQVDVQKLLEKISSVKNGMPKPLTDIERIVMKYASKNETPIAYTANAVLMQEVNPKQMEVQTPTYAAPEEVQSMAARLTSNTGVAEFMFGKPVVNAGRNLILSELNSAGFKNAQVAVVDNSQNSISYAVAIDNQLGFKVPVKVIDKKPFLPNVIVANGRPFAMTREGLNSLLSQGANDGRAIAATSGLYGTKPSALVDHVRDFMSKDNYVAAEDALHVLRNSGDQIAYKAAFDIYTQGLQGKISKKAHKTCSAPYRTKNSKYLICSHTGLPVHKVHIDEHGNCQRPYRKNMSQSSEGISTITSRIYFE